MEIILTEKVKEKLSEAVALWSEENLIGKPAILQQMMYFSLETKMIEMTTQINDKF